MNIQKATQESRRQLLKNVTITSVWATPVVSSVILPAHAQTSTMMCETDITVGGPLLGNASGATTCAAACEAEAISQNAELCDVRETITSNATDCACDLDLP